jgi:AraC-like DNA-binding protein
MPSSYCEYHPGNILSSFIECFWTSTEHGYPNSPRLHRVLPDGCMDLLFDFVADDNPRVSFVGTMTRPLTFTTTGAVDLLGVRFRPGCFPIFFALDAAELTDVRTDVMNYSHRFAREVWLRLVEAVPEDRCAVLQEVLLSRWSAAGIDPFVQHCVARIEASRGALRIAELERSTGVSGRHIERKFARHLGISPKTFARVVRFKNVAALAANPVPLDWVGVAGDLGFADQPHLVREIKAFSGLTPTEFMVTSRA